MRQTDTTKATFEDLYLKERKKATIFMVTTAILGLLLVGSLVFKASGRHSASGGGPFGALHGGGDEDMPSGGAAAILQTDISDFFTADGSVDTDKLNELKARVPAQLQSHIPSRLEPRIDEAVANGEITSAQADDLKNALSTED